MKIRNQKLIMAACLACASIAPSAAPAQSLYDEQTFRPLTADNKARQVGDVITIQVVENAIATANADTGSQRRNMLSFDLLRPGHSSLSGGLNTGGEFDGGGSTTRAGKLITQLTVSVQAIMPNGDLVLSGEQALRINDELQRIRITGRVRPVDISESNVVLSTRVADADITYAGEGHLAERQRPSWWRALFDFLGF